MNGNSDGAADDTGQDVQINFVTCFYVEIGFSELPAGRFRASSSGCLFAPCPYSAAGDGR